MAIAGDGCFCGECGFIPHCTIDDGLAAPKSALGDQRGLVVMETVNHGWVTVHDDWLAQAIQVMADILAEFPQAKVDVHVYRNVDGVHPLTRASHALHPDLAQLKH